jgi:signal transduction histidine kinase
MTEARALPSKADVLLAAALAVLAVVELTLDYAFERTPEPGPTPWHFTVAAVTGLSLVFRRTHPREVAVLVGVLVGSEPFLVAPTNVYLTPIIAAVATYSLVLYAPRWRDAVPPGALLLVGLTLGGTQDPDDPWGSAITAVIVTLLILAVGGVVRRYREGTDAMQTERDRAEAHAREIAALERARIARELHDVVAHGMSVVVLQAVGGRRMLDSDPRQARDAFDTIERVAGQCLGEMRRLLGILRAHDEHVPLAPQPRLGELPALVDQVRASGADVTLTTTGEPRELAPAIELSAYRIVQEAVTNAVKHAPGSAVRLTLGYEPDAFTIHVEDDGTGTRARDGSPGHGLIGMRERAELFGGSLVVSTPPGGGFTVDATLPLTGTDRR